jgi:hypothetical protein
MSDLTNLVKLFVGMVEHAGDLKRFEDERPPKYTERRGPLGERVFEASPSARSS